MGSLTLQYPPMGGGSAEQQLDGLRRYLIQMADRLNGADWSAQAVLTEVQQAINAADIPQSAARTEHSGYAALRSLIIKTADYAAENSEELKLKLSGNYVAVSDFGKYWREATLTVQGNELGIEQLFEYAAGVNNAYTVNSKQYVKTGLLYYDGVTPVYGLGVGNIETTVANEKEVIDRTRNELLTVTPGRIGFWQDGSEIAYLTGKKFHFPAGTLEAYSAKLTGTVTAGAGSSFGPWTISETSFYRGANTWGGTGLYFGTGGLSVKDRFTVDASGALRAQGAVVSGSIVATGGYIGSWAINGSELRAPDGLLRLGKTIISGNGIEAEGTVYGRCLLMATSPTMERLHQLQQVSGETYYIPLARCDSSGNTDIFLYPLLLSDLINYIADNYGSSTGAEPGGTSFPGNAGSAAGYASVCTGFAQSAMGPILTRSDISAEDAAATGRLPTAGRYYSFDQMLAVTDPSLGSGVRFWAANMTEYAAYTDGKLSGATGASWTNGSFFVQAGQYVVFSNAEIST